MKRTGAAVLAICGTLGGPAAAAPCVGTDLQTPLPGASGVEVRHADVPSALFGGTWQQGRLGGFAYQIHANGSAVIGDAPAMAGWRVDLTCDPEARRCARVATGDGPAEALPLAGQIEACLLGPEPAPPARAEAAPAAESPSAPAEAARPAAEVEASSPPAAEPPAPAAPGAAQQGSGTPGPAPTGAPATGTAAAREQGGPQAPPPEPEQDAGSPSAAARQPDASADPQPAASDQALPDPQRQAGSEPERATDAPEAPDTDPPAAERLEPQAGQPQAEARDDAAPAPARQVPAGEAAPPSDEPRADAARDNIEPMQLLESGDGPPAAETPMPEASSAPAAEVLRPDRPRPRPIRPHDPEPREGRGGPAILPVPPREASPRQASPARTAAVRSRPDAAARFPARARVERRTGVTPPPQPPAAGTVTPKTDTPRPAPEEPASFRTSCTLGSSVTLDDGKLSSTLGCTLNYRNRLTASLSVIGYPLKGQKSSGDAEYTYALTWRMNRNLTLTYANYTAAFTDGRGLALLGDGRLQLSRRLPPLDLPGTKRKLGCSAFASAASRAPENAGLSCGLPVTDRLTLRMTGYLYLPGAQRDSDPDFSYSASWRLGPDVTLTWSNYANNRWFWNGSDQSEKFLRGGSLGLTYTTRF